MARPSERQPIGTASRPPARHWPLAKLQLAGPRPPASPVRPTHWAKEGTERGTAPQPAHSREGRSARRTSAPRGATGRKGRPARSTAGRRMEPPRARRSSASSRATRRTARQRRAASDDRFAFGIASADAGGAGTNEGVGERTGAGGCTGVTLAGVKGVGRRAGSGDTTPLPYGPVGRTGVGAGRRSPALRSLGAGCARTGGAAHWCGLARGTAAALQRAELPRCEARRPEKRARGRARESRRGAASRPADESSSESRRPSARSRRPESVRRRSSIARAGWPR